MTVGYDPVKSFELRMEARYDMSTQPTFLRTMGASEASHVFADSQTGFALQGVFKF